MKCRMLQLCAAITQHTSIICTYVIHELVECILPEIWWDNSVIYLSKAKYFKYIYDSLITSNTM
jgi:hypothetical protein